MSSPLEIDIDIDSQQVLDVDSFAVKEIEQFEAGQIACRVGEWRKLSSDAWLISNIQGVEIPFEVLPQQSREPRPYRLSDQESNFVDEKLERLVEKGIIEEVNSIGLVISNIFLRPKKDGKFRLILDLTWVNLHVAYEHFKMHSIQTALEMMRRDCWMGSIDLKDAYYSVPDWVDHRKYLRFRWGDCLYQFTVLPNGLACAPRVFTKILRPVFASLREKGAECFPYIDDSFVVADSVEKCLDTLAKLGDLLRSLGFVIHPEKSVLVPTRQLLFLGYLLDSQEFKVFLTTEKEEKLVKAGTKVLEQGWSSIREVAGLIGLMIAFSQALTYGAAHTKTLERDKIEALRHSRGDFEAKMCLSTEARTEITWWLDHVGYSGKEVREPPPSVIIFTDASTEGWGAHVGEATAGGRWSEEEKEFHINVLEIRAILFGLKSLSQVEGCHIRVMTDNTTALAYIKHQGGVRSPECNEQAQQVWSWAESRRIWLSIAHIPGVENVVADYKSRNFTDNTEWELNDRIFSKVVDAFGEPDVDLFASRLNTKVKNYVSWQPDPNALAIDAFSIPWSEFKLFYAFPPFSCVARAVEKAVEEEVAGILILPWWPTQAWWGRLVDLNLRTLKFRSKKNNLLPRGKPNNQEFLHNIPLVACRF